MKHKAKKISAVILSAVLAASSFSSIPAYADGETVQISSAEDFAAFSKNCTLDSWSRGKTINLTADISLADTDISPVPIFCGTFNGNGHTISGLDLDGGNSYQGLFRFVAEDGVINGLTVSGTVSADGAQEYAALYGTAALRASSTGPCMWAELQASQKKRAGSKTAGSSAWSREKNTSGASPDGTTAPFPPL